MDCGPLGDWVKQVGQILGGGAVGASSRSARSGSARPPVAADRLASVGFRVLAGPAGGPAVTRTRAQKARLAAGAHACLARRLTRGGWSARRRAARQAVGLPQIVARLRSRGGRHGPAGAVRGGPVSSRSASLASNRAGSDGCWRRAHSSSAIIEAAGVLDRKTI